MKKIILFISIVLFTSLIFSQGRDYKKIKALKVGYLTEELELQTEEAESFWPIYNAYEAKRNELRDEERSLVMQEASDIRALSNTEAKEILDKLKLFEKKEEKAEETYIASLEKVLSPKKIILLFRAEKDFRRRLLRKLRDERSGSQHRRPR